MDWKIFISTFFLIFLAELGDKTQLATMARAASSGSAKWTIFFAAAAALVVSTMVAVVFGSVLTKYVPERYIKVGAGVLFLIFGLLILREGLIKDEGPAKTGAAVEAPGLTHFVYAMAAQFEKAAFEDYRALAAKTQTPTLKALLEQLAAEEEGHFKQIQDVGLQHADVGLPPGAEPRMPSVERVTHNVAADDKPIIAHAIEHEQATAGFYAELARITPIPALQSAFTALAQAEEQHVLRLKEFQNV